MWCVGMWVMGNTTTTLLHPRTSRTFPSRSVNVELVFGLRMTDTADAGPYRLYRCMHYIAYLGFSDGSSEASILFGFYVLKKNSSSDTTAY